MVVSYRVRKMPRNINGTKNLRLSALGPVHGPEREKQSKAGGQVSFFFCFSFNWIFSLFTFQMFSPFQISPSRNPLSHPPNLFEGVPSPIHSCSHPGIPIYWGMELPQAQGPLHTLMSNMSSIDCKEGKKKDFFKQILLTGMV